ncbi:hypothetical protein Q3G72_016161 [Acer saccharum]|nr:hypothetical protein Q3G72_016161 [Acer saccharum]
MHLPLVLTLRSMYVEAPENIRSDDLLYERQCLTIRNVGLEKLWTLYRNYERRTSTEMHTDKPFDFKASGVTSQMRVDSQQTHYMASNTTPQWDNAVVPDIETTLQDNAAVPHTEIALQDSAVMPRAKTAL